MENQSINHIWRVGWISSSRGWSCKSIFRLWNLSHHSVISTLLKQRKLVCIYQRKVYSISERIPKKRFVKMKQLEETKIGGAKTKQVVPPPPPPLPQLPRFWVKKSFTESVTNQEIAKFWRQKRIEEEDHLLAAIKAAARIRAQNLSVRSYDMHFRYQIQQSLAAHIYQFNSFL